ncbi:MAG: hypothetical protein CVT67_11625 [Actinobacteria bacterium HGW-Actinobacteria-7]|nr:MAG: hypothetical protein CVT67_11625 [Actinobacteria bacterium HGW-Actinobacteria-7]
MDVSVVTVSYQSREDVLGLLASIGQHPASREVEVHVVDNASTDGTEDAIRQRYPDVAFQQMGYNSGFSRANNAAIVKCRGRYLLLLNPDTRVTAGCIDSLVGFMDQNPDVAAVGPKILNRDMSLQASIRNLPTLRGALLEAVFLHHFFPRFLARYGEMVYDVSAYESAHPVGWLSGAAMFVRRSALDQVGLLDEEFFLFSEEIDWFKRMNDAGLAVWFFPGSCIIHRDDKGDRNPNLIAIDVDSRRLYWHKHASAPVAFVAISILAFNMSVRYVLWSLVAFRGDSYAVRQRTALGRGLRALSPSGRPVRPTPEQHTIRGGAR